MKFRARLLFFVLALYPTSPLAAEPVAARRADELVDSVGVNTHFGYTDRPYAKRFDEVAAKLGELGVRHVRDGADARDDVAARLRTLHQKFGIRVVQIVGPRVSSPRPWTGKLDPAKIDGALATIKTMYGEANEAIEGPNEYDLTHKSDTPAADDADWPATLKAYTQALYEKVKADPVLKDRPVIGPSMAHASDAPKVADLSASITFGNFHPYPGGWNPSRKLDDYNLPKTRQMTGTRPLWATETGYQNAMDKPPGGHDPCPEQVAGKYGPRLAAEYFRRGIARAYFYELLDQDAKPADPEANFGLLRHDLSEKPIFSALKATIQLLQDPGGAFEPGKLDYSLSPSPEEVHQVLLQKRDGRFYLLLWQEVACYDAAKRQSIAVSPREVTLKLPAGVQKVTTYLPGTGGVKPAAVIERPGEVKLSVPDELLVVEVAAAAPPAAPPAARFEKEIEAFEAADKASPPPQGAVLFVGDSGIKQWTTLARDFPDQKVINRGFGGSQMADATYYADRIVIPYKPRLIVLREGGNDLTAGRTAEQLLADLQAFVAKVREKLPDTRIAVFSLNPNPARWDQAEKRKAANALLKAYVQGQKGLEWIEVWDSFLGPDGKPREDLFGKDRLHNNAEGNKLYADAVRTHLK